MSFNFIASGMRTLAIEQQAIAQVQLSSSFADACELLLNCSGKVVTMGVGKSGHIARKISSTLASTGTQAFFVHPAEASHGDLGMLSAEDVVLLFSHSGRSAELLALLPLFKRMGVATIAISGIANSPIATSANVHINVAVSKEACPLDLAPTASTTATLAVGDALAIALLEARGFNHDDFAFSHPGGSLGRKLLIKLSDIMHTGADLPQVPIDAHLTTALLAMTAKGLGTVCVVDDDGRLQGIYTDGDLRRTIDSGYDLQSTKISQVMTTNPHTMPAAALAAEAATLMESKKINAVVALDKDGRIAGIANMHDLLRAQVV